MHISYTTLLFWIYRIPQECCHKTMSYTELEYGYQGLRKAARPTEFYVGGVSCDVASFEDFDFLLLFLM